MIEFINNSSSIHSVLAFYLPLVFSILSLICCVLFLFTYLKYEKLRINSGKIHFILGFCITFVTGHLLGSLFYEVEYENGSDSYAYSGWCTALGVITNIVIYNFLLLNLFLCHNLLCCILYKDSTFNKRYKIYLVLSMTISVIFTIILGVFSDIGYGPLGFCWIRDEKVAQIIHIITLAVVFPLAIGILIYVYSKEHFITPHSLYYYNEDNFTQNSRKIFIRINLGYIFVFTLTWLPASIIYFLHFIFIRCDSDIKDGTWFEIVRAIALIFLCSSAFSMFLVRINEPVVKKAVRKYIFRFGAKKTEQQQENSQNLDSREAKDVLTLEEHLIEQNLEKDQKLNKKKINKGALQPQQYDVLLMHKKAKSSSDLFAFLKKKNTLLKSNSRIISDKEKSDSKLLLSKCFLASLFLIRNDINNQVISINAKTPWEEHYYNDVTNLKSKLGDLIRIVMKNDDETMDKILEAFHENLLDDINCMNVASIVFSNIKTLYNIDNIKLFDSFYPPENIKILDIIDYDPLALKEEISINNFICFNNQYYLKILSEMRVVFLKESFLRNLHDHYTRSKGNSFLAPLISLYILEMSFHQSVNVGIYENLIGQIPPLELYSLIIFEGVNVIHKKFKNGVIVSTEFYAISGFEMENVLKLKYKDKSLLMKIMKSDLKFLLSKDITNYQVHLIFSKNPQKVKLLKNTVDQKSVNSIGEDMTSSQFPSFPQRKNGFKFECFLEDYECRVVIHNYLNTHKSFPSAQIINNYSNTTINLENPGSRYGTETNVHNNNLENKALMKKSSGINENFSPVNPDVYAKNIMDGLQELL